MAISTRHIEPLLSDSTPPVATISSGPTKSKISRIVGQDSFDITWQSNENFSNYQIRLVTNSSDSVTQGTLIEQDENPASGGNANTDYTSTVTDDELVAAGGAEGSSLLKIFVRDLGENWSA